MDHDDRRTLLAVGDHALAGIPGRSFSDAQATEPSTDPRANARGVLVSNANQASRGSGRAAPAIRPCFSASTNP